ncbi:MAG: hypothetical protein HPZ91_13230 [Lentisphaeria bacterium]|nr:hypothetical protein [Lentisphaeria bacterium]
MPRPFLQKAFPFAVFPLLLFALCLVFSGAAHPSRVSNQHWCRNNLNSLSVLLASYAEKNGGRLPDRNSLEGWNMLGEKAAEFLFCPERPHRPPSSERGNPYFYFGALAAGAAESGEDEIIAIEKRAHHDYALQLLTFRGNVFTVNSEQPGIAYAVSRFHKGKIHTPYRRRLLAEIELLELQQRTRQSRRRTRAEFRKYIFFSVSSGLLLVILAAGAVRNRLRAGKR